MQQHIGPGPASRALLDAQLEISVAHLVCPLSADEIAEWARRLGGTSSDDTRRLKNLVTYWFDQAKVLLQAIPATDSARLLQYIKDRRDQGYVPEAAMKALPEDFDRIDKWLPDIAKRLNAIHSELLVMPGDVKSAIRIAFGDNYKKALDCLTALPEMLHTIAETWHRPRPGGPSLEWKSRAIEMLVFAVEDFTGMKFPSPRVKKRPRVYKIDFVRELAKRLPPSFTCKQIGTMLGHIHNRRNPKAPRE